jgi:hypothetical protein
MNAHDQVCGDGLAMDSPFQDTTKQNQVEGFNGGTEEGLGWGVLVDMISGVTWWLNTSVSPLP